jgi:hypothetical protein
MDLSDEELDLLQIALDKKIWSLDHVGLSSTHPTKIAFKALRTRVVAERSTRVHPSEDQR